MKALSILLEEQQLTALDAITTERVPRVEHIRRAIDMYLSQPAIMDALTTVPTQNPAATALAGRSGRTQ